MKENKIPVLCSTILLLAFTLMSCTDKVTAPKFKSHVDLSVIENDMLSFSNGYNAGKEGERTLKGDENEALYCSSTVS